MRILPALVLLVATLTTSATAQTSAAARPDSTKQQLLHELFVQTRTVDLIVQTIEAGIPAQRTANPQIPVEFWDRLVAAVRDQRPELEAMVTQIYDRHFEVDDLRGLIAFYRTPLGQKVLMAQPEISRESIEAGAEWGQRLGMRVAMQMTTEQAKKAP